MSPSGEPATTTGLVLDLQRFSIHDGPGIRTTVFLKGCSLRCPWCQNPEARDPTPEVLFTPSLCIDCRQCLSACPRGAIRVPGPRRIEPARCRRCGACAEACPTGALEPVGLTMTVESVLAEVLRDEAYYRRSGGGMTLSGGEPLAQDLFALELLRAARQRGLHTVVETAGHVAADVLDAAAAVANTIYLDLKLVDPEEHRRLVGSGNERILENARRLARHGAPLELRMPLLPGINDGEENLARTAAFVRELGGRSLRIVPYQRGYLGKAHAAATPAFVRAIEPPSPAALGRARSRLAEAGVETEIDG